MSSRFILILLAVVSVAGLVLANSLPQDVSSPNEITKNQTSNVFCEVCKQIVNRIRDPVTLELYSRTFRQLCKYIPFKAKCESIIDVLARAISTMSPEAFCQQAQLCEAELPRFLSILVKDP